MIRAWISAALGLLGLLGLPAPGEASYIKLDTTSSSLFSENRVQTAVTVANHGDESAYSVWTEAILRDSTARSALHERLDAGQSLRATNDLGASPAVPGIYTVAIKIHYEDANGHPYTALTSVPLVTTTNIEQRVEPLQVAFPHVRMNRHARCTLSVSSASSLPVDATITLVLPDEIEHPTAPTPVSLAPGQKTELRFDLRNRRALPGSTYPVFAVVDCLLGGEHRSYAVPGLVSVEPPWWQAAGRFWMLVPVILLLGCFGVRQLWPLLPPPFPEEGSTRGALDHFWSRAGELIFVVAILLALLTFTRYHIPFHLLLLDTVTTGGDTPAHNYLASHLKDSLFSHGKIVSWAGGWWCGFPMFQFYFPLPYLLIALLDTILPFNVAFKLVSVLGIFALPAAAWGSARLFRFPRPVPELLAVAMIALLFDRTNTMWGVNIYSTLAGMIANSLSFCIMLLFLACAWRDAADGRFRLRTVLLLVLLIASHFFTSLMAGLVLLPVPLLQPKGRRVRALTVLAMEAGLGFLLMAWWLLPLLAKGSYSVDFGHDWTVNLCRTIPRHVFWLYPLILIAPVLALAHKDVKPALLIAWMLLVSVFLFAYGSRVSTVFDNVRQWPFIHFSLLSLGAIGLGLLLRWCRAFELAVTAALLVALTWGIGAPNDVRGWAGWNYEGMEMKKAWPAFQRLVMPLKGTPGRLAYDSHHDNNAFGSDRAFEAVPHLIGKPVLEGGIVNSALGSMFSYYIQGETSRGCAGFPNIVTPAPFNFTNATRHLELFNVKHFIARWDKTREALAGSKDWRRLAAVDGWELYELTTHDGRYVFIPENYPAAVRLPRESAGTAWKKAGLYWMYTVEAMDQFFALLGPQEDVPDPGRPLLSLTELRRYLRGRHSGATSAPLAPPVPRAGIHITEEEISDNRIRFRTEGVGLPHIIKCSYYPNWQVRGAKAVYMVTPGFMLVYPRQEQVELYYGYTLSDNAGRLLSLVGLVAAAGILVFRRRGKPREQLSNNPSQVP